MKTKTIKDRTYSCDVLPVRVSLEVLARFTNLAGDTLSAAALGDEDSGALVSAFGTMLKTVSADDVGFFCERFGSVSECEGTSLSAAGARDRVFRGKLGNMFQWLRFCFEVNYSDFFEDVQSLTVDVPSDAEK